MSQWGAILDDLLAKVDTAMTGTTLPAGRTPIDTVTTLRRYRTPEQLREASAVDMDATKGRAIVIGYVTDAPHSREESGRQVERGVSIQLQTWLGYSREDLDAQEDAYLLRDSIVAAIAADPELGGTVRDAFAAGETPAEMPESGAIVLVIDVSCIVEVVE